MNLTIDIGNTRTKFAYFHGDQLLHQGIWDAQKAEDLTNWQNLLTNLESKTLSCSLPTYNQKVENVILCSVKKEQHEVHSILKQVSYFLELTTTTPLPIKNLYHTPETLGKDRLAAVIGAFQLYPNAHCLVIDAGTCITYDLLTATGEYLGGNIAPGVELRLKAMHHFTAKLPKVTQNLPKSSIGVSTETAMQNGGLLGAALEMQGFIELYKVDYRPLNVLLTGGNADFFAKTLKTKIFAHPNLVLTGLNKILQHNVLLHS